MVALPERHPLAAHLTIRLDQLGELPVRLTPAANNPPFPPGVPSPPVRALLGACARVAVAH